MRSARPIRPSRFFFHFDDEPFNAQILHRRIQEVILRNSHEPRTADLMGALAACKKLQASEAASSSRPNITSLGLDQFGLGTRLSAESILTALLKHEPVQNILREDISILQYLCNSIPALSTSEALRLAKNYFDENGSRHRSSRRSETNLVYSIMRNALYQKDLYHAFGAVDLSFPNSENTGGRESFWSSGRREYFQFLDRTVGSQDGLRVAWSGHTSLRYRFFRCDELLMVNRIVVAYDEVLDVNVRNFHRNSSRVIDTELDGYINEELRRRHLQLLPTPEESLYQSYWKTGGLDLEWVEPDQDPSDRWTA